MAVTEESLALDLAAERRLIRGLEGLASMPPHVVQSEEAKKEVREALSWSIARAELIENTLESLKALLDHGYPDRIDQVASEDVVNALRQAKDLIDSAVDSIHVGPTGTMTVSEPIPVE